METNELYRGRLIDHLQLVVNDIEKSRRFYSAIFKVLGIPIHEMDASFFWADELVVSSKDSPAAQGHTTGPSHFAFQAENEAMVKAFYDAGLKAGGKDNGAPGLRPYHLSYYAAFLIDPDGNNVEAVFHGQARRSAPAIKIEF